MRRWFTRMQEAWTVMRWEPEELIDAGDWVIARVRFSSTAAHSGIEYDVERFQTMRVEDGRIAFATGYGTLEKARTAVGLDG
jgi:ketosteroid isomerase-like protein